MSKKTEKNINAGWGNPVGTGYPSEVRSIKSSAKNFCSGVDSTSLPPKRERNFQDVREIAAHNSNEFFALNDRLKDIMWRAGIIDSHDDGGAHLAERPVGNLLHELLLEADSVNVCVRSLDALLTILDNKLLGRV
jgi:hypothetical protein